MKLATENATDLKFLAAFGKYLDAIIRHDPDMKTSYSEGPRNYKILQSKGATESVHSFVDRRSGDILKAASWNAPARHARGNIYDEDHGASALIDFGVKYLR